MATLPNMTAHNGADGPQPKPHILLVDDQELLAELTKENLQFLGFTVTVFTDSVAALEAYRADPACWNLIVTDETMPRLSGFELARAVRDEGGNTPIILTTGYSRVADEARIASLGNARLLMKPYPVADLADAVRSMIA